MACDSVRSRLVQELAYFVEHLFLPSASAGENQKYREQVVDLNSIAWLCETTPFFLVRPAKAVPMICGGLRSAKHSRALIQRSRVDEVLNLDERSMHARPARLR